MILTNKEASLITNGKSNTNWEANGISIDSRTIKPGELFIALKGNNFNGHNFIPQAFKRGASVAIVEISENIQEFQKYPLLLVKDSYQALLDIAKYKRKNYKGKVIAITGSVGKTTTKEMLKLALTGLTNVYASTGNFNNHIGMPLCLANIDNKSHVAVFELGMSNPKEISFLSNILQPHYAIITEVSNAHTAFFHSLKEVFLAKMEIIDGLKQPKVLIFNINNQFFSNAKQMTNQFGGKIFGFGKYLNKIPKSELNTYNVHSNQVSSKDYKQVKLSNYHKKPCNYDSPSLSKVNYYCEKNINISTDFLLLQRKVITIFEDKQIKFYQKLKAKIGNLIYSYNLPTLAEHKAVLSTLVLGIIYLLKYDLKKAISNLSNYLDIKGRGNIEFINLQQRNIGFYLLNDSYNASPLSMKKSILSLKDINLISRKILVLGDMLELSNEVLEHQKLKEYILEIKTQAIFTLGSNMKYLINVLPSCIDKFSYLSDKLLLQKLKTYLQNNDIVLIKGSLGSNIYKIAEELNN